MNFFKSFLHGFCFTNERFVLFICFIYFVVIGQGYFGTVEKGLWNNLPIVLKKLNEIYSDKMTNVFLKEARLLNNLRH